MRRAQRCLAARRGIGFVASVLAMLAAGGSVAFAQVTGKVIGTVTDRDTDRPLVGGQIVVEGTNLGNVTNDDGYYFINNVAVGTQSLTAQYLGYESATSQQLVLAGQTMTVDFALASSVVRADAIVARIEREPLVIRDNMISKSRFTAEDARNLPVRDIESVIELGAGIYRDRANCGIASARDASSLRTGCGFIIRGGRATESATYVDGALMTDFNSQTNLTGISNFAIEEVDVITGGFNAEFGHAQSGIINIVTREGDGELHGSLRFTTDELSDAFGQSFGYNDLQVSLGGPILTDRLMAYGSFQATGAADFFPAAAGFNPAVGDQLDNSGSTKELLPGNRGDRTQAQAKLSAFLPFAAKLTGTYLYSRDQFESHQPSRGIQQFTSITGTRTKTLGLILGYDQQLFQTGERNLNLQVRGSYQRSEFFQGTPLTRAMSRVLEEHSRGECGAACVVEVDAFDQDLLNYRIGDVEFFFEDSTINSVFGMPLPGGENPDPVFGQPNVFFTRHGFFPLYRKQNESRYGVRLDLDSQLDRVHRAKLGVEWNWIALTHGGGSFDGDALADVYDVDPIVGAAYIQDRLDFGDLVIDVGLRWDHWNPNAVFPLLPGLVDCSIVVLADAQCREAEVREARARSEWSPRFGVAHPITDVTQVRLSYGKFYQLPQLQHFFSSYLTDEKAGGVMGAGVNYGNPDLDFVETTAFEAGITHQVSQDFVIDLVTYNRDRRGAVRVETFGSRVIDPLVEERRIFVNGDNGNVKGLDITLTRRLSSYWSMDLSWSLQWARGTTSSPLDWAAGFGALFTPEEAGGVAPPPTQLQPEDFDRLHNVNLQVSLQLPDDTRAGTLWGGVLRNFDIFMTYNAQSGTPFTRTDAEDRAVEDFGESRQPWFHSGDVRVAKGFDVGGLDLRVFGLVENFLGTQNVIVVNSATGLPNVAGTEFVDSRNPRIAEGFLVERVVRDFPIALDEILPEWRDEFARQDLDGDGLITLEESQETAFRAEVALSNAPLNYGSPRQIRFGAEIRF